MYWFIALFEWIGTVSFALSGALVGVKKRMDIFGVCILGLTTAVGGGIIRDLILGITPPSAFRHPRNALAAIVVSALVFVAAARHWGVKNRWQAERLVLWADSAGLGIFTVCGLQTAMEAGYADNLFLLVFVAVLTGVGGGVLRDVFAGDRPYIFVKHIYASAALLGALLCRGLWPVLGQNMSMTAGFVLVVVIRLCSARFRWSLPRIREE